jgi:hypothetical protein
MDATVVVEPQPVRVLKWLCGRGFALCMNSSSFCGIAGFPVRFKRFRGPLEEIAAEKPPQKSMADTGQFRKIGLKYGADGPRKRLVSAFVCGKVRESESA